MMLLTLGDAQTIAVMTPEYDRNCSNIPTGSSAGRNRSKGQDEVLWLKAQKNVRKQADVQFTFK